MHIRVVATVSAVLFVLLAISVGIVADLHDRDFPVELGATSAVSLDFTESGLSDAEAFRQLGSISDRLELGLVKVAPNLDGVRSSQVFIMVGTEAHLPTTIQRFGDQPDSQIRTSEQLAHSFASGEYLVTGNRDGVEDFQVWLATNHIDDRWNADTLSSNLELLIRQPVFATTLLAAIALMVSLVLYWLSVKAKGRALRVLAGVPTWRIQIEDLGGFLAAISASALSCLTVALIYVALAHGWVFIFYYARTLLTFNIIVICTTLMFAVVISLASWPSVRLLAAREPAVKSLQKSSAVLKAITFTLLLAAVAPVATAYADSSEAAAQQARWRSLADQVVLSFPAGMGESGFVQRISSVADVVNDAENIHAVGLSYTWTNDLANGDLGPYDHVSIVNQQWLNLMLAEGNSADSTRTQPHSALIPLTQEHTPVGVRQLLGAHLELWSREELTAADALDQMSIYEYAGPTRFPMALGGDLVFSDDVIVVVAPALYDMFDDDFLASAASTSNLVFTGLESTQALLSQHGLQNEVLVKYVAEEGVLRAQLAEYFAWLQGASLVALIVALIVSSVVAAFITAALLARRDFPMRLAGKRWMEILADRVLREWSIGIVLTAVIILLRGTEGGVFLAAVAAAALLLSPLSHHVAASWAFNRMTMRNL